VFGKVVKGQEVVDEIEKVETTRVGMYRDVPCENIIITNVTVG
jgi:peptidyl-prolyl cis-trans isomerase B (cyclophilin B)